MGGARVRAAQSRIIFYESIFKSLRLASKFIRSIYQLGLAANGHKLEPAIGQPDDVLQSLLVSLTAPGLVALALSEQQPLLVSLTAPGLAAADLSEQQPDLVSDTAPGLAAADFSAQQPDLVSDTAPGLAAADLSAQQPDLVSDTAPGLAAATLSLHAAVVHLLLSLLHAPSVLQDLPPQQPLTAPGEVVGVL